MNLNQKIKQGRQKMNLTQQELADRLHVTRQALSKWENDQSYPNLDILVEMSKVLHISLNELLGEQDKVVAQISNDVRKKRRYFKLLVSIFVLITLLILSSGIFIYGRIHQIDRIDEFNPFLPTRYGYAVLPDKVPTKKIKEFINYGNGKKGYEMRDDPQPVDAFVTSDPFGEGQWLKFSVGDYNKNQRWALLRYKGSYVSAARPISKNNIPNNIKDIIGNRYFKYDKKNGGNRYNVHIMNF
ncbi:helix-turn-helix domain-containing protein [Apilactobacillus apisilvae]|uniref:Helix-turn-helix domain-containing protein n=1 Tax=Apilactobacillus apisilvae TaxID=2923364 RepID=A0ABY4PGZ6_9LACO|nr:helix-turn-helix domain-containing protein [Apilactobacillus apisilvae]UQS84751.1 helix-turn-helix domain-containing protein [Apilactobacillus apisilvae]